MAEKTMSDKTKVEATVTSEDPFEVMVAKVVKAQKEFSTYTQAQVDKIFRAASLAANEARIRLAKMAVEETKMGILEDKVIKNHFSSEFIYNKYKDEKTVGILEHESSYGIYKVAEPIGVIAGIIPTTNPTSTTIFKSLISLKTRNGIIFSPHPNAKKSTAEAARIVLEAAVEAGAPQNIIACIETPSLDLSNRLMQHKDISLILATGGPGMVKAAYSSGTPAIGVGPGNTPALIDETADLRMAVNAVILSKTFDNGVVCASEQVIVVQDSVYDKVKQMLSDAGAHILSKAEKKRVDEVILRDQSLNAAIVGQSAAKIAEMGDVTVPENTKILIGECDSPDRKDPFIHEKLSPVLGMLRFTSYEQGLNYTAQIVNEGGIGHTALLFTDPMNTERIQEFGERMNAGRVLVNMPASQGAIGDLYNFMLEPSLTLGCGSWGGNAVSENVGVKHLLNIKRIAERRENMQWFRVPSRIYHKYGSLPVALQELKGKKRAFLVTDKPLFDLGYTERITSILEPMEIEVEIFHNVIPDPTFEVIEEGVARMRDFNPDVIIALGGGSPMDAAKVMWLLYENPNMDFDGMAMRFMDIRKRIYEFPELGRKAYFVAIPTTSGTGSEVTPFSVVTDGKTHVKYPLADYAITPDMAIIDSELVLNMPKGLTAASGIDGIVHAIEAFVSVLATDYTNGLALESLRVMFKYLPAAYKEGADNPYARERVHNASTLAGMAFANAFLGICHSMAHKLGAAFNIPHGVANALLISYVIRYNADDAPTKLTAFPQYDHPSSASRYAKIANYLELGGKTKDDKVNALIGAIEDLKEELNIPKSIQAYGIKEKDFLAVLDDLSENAFDDQCTGANPRYPLIAEIKQLYLDAYYGKTLK